MPVLPLEPYLYPATLFGPSAESDGPASAWWVLHTRPRAEKVLARHLWNRSISFFLPLYQRERLFRGRVLTSYLPLFTGYVFLRGNEQSRLQALKTNTVAKAIPVNDQAQLSADLTRVYQLMASGAPLAPEDRLRPGSWVEITSGPLAGLEGKVIRRGKRLKFVIEVQFLQRGASVEIDGWMIEPRQV
jgi:transcriptional antiterminator RfaH